METQDPTIWDLLIFISSFGLGIITFQYIKDKIDAYERRRDKTDRDDDNFFF